MSVTINILGINISALSKKEIEEKINLFLTENKSHQIVTPNPEFLLASRHDEEFFYILNQADLAIPDGFGLKISATFLGKKIYRYTGADLINHLFKIASNRKYKIAVINNKDGLSLKNDIESKIAMLYPELSQLVIDEPKTDKPNEAIINRLGEFMPDILFCTFGAPSQEKFIYHALLALPYVKIGLGVGGGFDFITGKIRRAPGFFRKIGMEWLWRLIQQPWRWKRIYRALILFPLIFIDRTYIKPHFYRPNVVCLLFKKENSKIYILILERSDATGHWQLPQGGTDSEKLSKAGARELREELGTGKFKVIKCYKNLYKYDFGESAGKYKSKKHTGYKGQKQGLCITEFTGNDSDIKINFWDHQNWKWVSVDNFLDELNPVRRDSGKIFLEMLKETVKSSP